MVDLTQQHNPDHRQHGDGEQTGADTAAAGLLSRLFSRFGLASWMVGGESGNSGSSSSLPTTAVSQGSSSQGSDSDSRAQGDDAPASSGSTARSSANGSQSRYSTQASQPERRSNGTGARQTQTQTQTQAQFGSAENWRDADEDDDMGLPNGSTSFHGMSGARSSHGNGGSYVRRTPMYTEHVRDAQPGEAKIPLA